MTDGGPRSVRVIAAYKQHKLSVSALCHIRRLLRQFEREREFDRRAARYGVVIIFAVLAFAAFSRFGVAQAYLF